MKYNIIRHFISIYNLPPGLSNGVLIVFIKNNDICKKLVQVIDYNL